MKRAGLTVVILAVSAFSAGSAFAQAKGKPKAGGKAETAEGYQKVKNYDFEADDISGELTKPTGEFSQTPGIANHKSLIRPRLDFIKEIVKSAEDL